MSDANWCRVNGLGSDVSSANTHRKKNRSRMFYFCIWLLFSSFVFRTVIRIDSRFICIFTIRRSNCETESKKLEYLQQRERDECWWIEGKWKKKLENQLEFNKREMMCWYLPMVMHSKWCKDRIKKNSHSNYNKTLWWNEFEGNRKANDKNDSHANPTSNWNNGWDCGFRVVWYWMEIDVCIWRENPTDDRK